MGMNRSSFVHCHFLRPSLPLSLFLPTCVACASSSPSSFIPSPIEANEDDTDGGVSLNEGADMLLSRNCVEFSGDKNLVG